MKIIKATRGSGLDLQNAIEDKIAQLNGRDITSASNIDDTTRDRYLHNLIGDVESSLKANGIQNLSFDQDDRNLYVTVGDTLEEYQVPFKDLSFDFDNIDKDEKYIVDEITSSCSSSDKTSVQGSSLAEIQALDIIKYVKSKISNEVDDLHIEIVDDTIDIVARYDDQEGYWVFAFDELNLPLDDPHDYEAEGDYICNTILSWLDDPEVEE